MARTRKSYLERRQIQGRSKVLYVAVMCAFIACIGQLIRIQLIDGPALAQAALSARTFNSEVVPQRGDITDAKGTVLATSIERYDIVVNQKQVKRYLHRQVVDVDGNKVTDKKHYNDPGNKVVIVGTGAAEAARVLAPILQMDRAELGGQLVGDRGYLLIKKGVLPETWRTIRQYRIDGIDGIKNYERSYPNGATGASILGFTDIDGKGIDGIEATMEKYLKGTPGSREMEISPSGQVIPGGTDEGTPAKPGSTLQLTIDADLQHFTQTKIDEVTQAFNADWASAVVVEVATGKVLALADSGLEPPLEMRKKKGGIRSHCVESVYEPGSTGKLVTFAAALEEKKITPTTPFSVPYRITMPGPHDFRDSHDHPTLQLTATGVLAHSSNTGTVQVGNLVEDSVRFEKMKKFGWGQPTGIELPGETPGILADYHNWEPRQRYTTMFGQSLGTSVLQIASLVATIANDGVRMPIHIAEKVTDPYGKVTQLEHSKPVEALDRDVARTLSTMMESVGQKGATGYAGVVPGYRTALKTGTSESPHTPDSPSGVVASTAGFLPADDPKIAINVVVFRPKSGTWGGVVAAPTFSAIGKQAMALLDIPPSTGKADLYPQESGTQ
ncbi:MAG: penicillin-binding protein 2 [Actinomycetaceae bacterium]|nr:penicillin-binding protein 2 [Actinomycetaceae bacterium]